MASIQNNVNYYRSMHSLGDGWWNSNESVRGRLTCCFLSSALSAFYHNSIGEGFISGKENNDTEVNCNNTNGFSWGEVLHVCGEVSIVGGSGVQILPDNPELSSRSAKNISCRKHVKRWKQMKQVFMQTKVYVICQYL